MDHEFWLERWRTNQIGFHQGRTNPLLKQYWSTLGVTKGVGVFVPLCGKSLDMRYLEAEGHPVIGVELSQEAIQAYFDAAGERCQRQAGFYLTRYSGPRTTIYCGDFFDLSASDILGVRAVYDRGALVALPRALRARYVDHLLRIVPEHAHMLLITLEYDQEKLDGPPFSVGIDEVTELFRDRARLERIASVEAVGVPPKFREAGLDAVTEGVYHIVKEH